MFFMPYTTSSVVLEVDDWSVVDFSVLDCSSVTTRGVDDGEDSSVMGEVSVVSVVLLPLLPELLLLGLELLDEGRGSVTWKPNTNCYESALSKGPNRVDVSPPPFHLRKETDPVSETLCSLVFRIPDDGQSTDTRQF
jgi:hypothetical protein